MNLKKALMITVAAAAFAATGNAAPAGIVNVPFAFKYFGQQMPAGRYYFAKSDAPNRVLLTNIDTRSSVQVLTRAANGAQPALRLVFNNHDGNRTLRFAE